MILLCIAIKADFTFAKKGLSSRFHLINGTQYHKILIPPYIVPVSFSSRESCETVDISCVSGDYSRQKRRDLHFPLKCTLRENNTSHVSPHVLKIGECDAFVWKVCLISLTTEKEIRLSL